MARKVASVQAPTVEPASPPDVEQDEQGAVILRAGLLLLWRALDAEVRAAAMVLKDARRELDLYVEKNPALREMLERRDATAAQHGHAVKQLDEVLARIERATGVPPKRLSIDDQSGRVYDIGPKGPVPVMFPSPNPTPKKRSRPAAKR